MATYTELRQLFADNDLRNRVQVACIVAAETIRSEDAGTTNHANRLVWAKSAFNNPTAVCDAMLMALLAVNKAQTVEMIQGVEDTTLQSQVDAAVDVFADGS